MRVEITCANRVGILHEIMQIFGNYRINVASGELGGDSGDKVYLSAPGMLATQYQTIEKSLHRVPGIQRVRRVALLPLERRHFELDTLLRHVTDPVLSVDREGRVVAANLAAARAFGVSLDRVPGLQLQRFLPLMQVAELLRDFAVPRYGLPIVVRGQSFRVDWSPIALEGNPGAVGSLAGAVLRLQPWDSSEFVAELPRPMVLWDFDFRRQSCLQLQDLSALTAPLLIVGERGSGKTTFACALHYLSPAASRADCYRVIPRDGKLELPTHLRSTGTLILEDVHTLSAEAQIDLLRKLQNISSSLRLVATTCDRELIAPPLAQVFSSLAMSLPPLRNIRPALPRLANTLLRQEIPEAGDLKLDEEVQQLIKLHDWPDNFNGLRDYLTAATSQCLARGGHSLGVGDVPDFMVKAALPWRDWGRGLSYKEMMEQLERALLTNLIEDRPSTRELAKELGISHTAVANKLRKYGLSASKK
ncbi:PAS domain-containing protein [Microbulbifer sp. OS29]|uniref:PAS domain-containing protein n=1 Tax=Microbulbifer okhotskensis TaxID=2926617 RepID=A0A9X2J6C0_9GAMM|nr:TyrR/PhhR family helix-turn-helix DNA-binding protein [Microbulbifer okhotskensis]MCO1336477.1 PAS domain-containing protein [Microbulbifer okhotskensis]